MLRFAPSPPAPLPHEYMGRGGKDSVGGLPRVAVSTRQPWAVGFNPFGVKTCQNSPMTEKLCQAVSETILLRCSAVVDLGLRCFPRAVVLLAATRPLGGSLRQRVRPPKGLVAAV